MTPLYQLIRVGTQALLRVYFSRIKIEGAEHIPKDCPLLILPNHQNALLDPMLVGAYTPVQLNYLTRSDVFTKRTVPIFSKLNMIPIYRRRDGYKKLSLNESVFAECMNRLERKEAVLIFPEGNHGEEYFLRPLTKGAARLALQAQQSLSTDLMILPVGINYFDHKSPRSSVLLKFGVPFTIRAYSDMYEANPARGLTQLRDHMAECMKKLLVLPDDFPGYEQAKQLLFQPKHHHLSFAELVRLDINTLAPEETRSKRRWVAWFFNPIPFLAIRHLLRQTEDVVFFGTIKLAAGVVFFGLWWLIAFSILWSIASLQIALLGVVVMVSSLFISYD